MTRDDAQKTPSTTTTRTRQSPRIQIEEVAEKPWKYLGYRQFSQFLASDNDFMVLRRFGSLHVRILLALQDEIAALEEELGEIDRLASSPEKDDVHNGTFRDDELESRSALLREIKEKLVEYDDFLERTSRLRALPRARSHDVASVTRWLFNNNDPIRSKEVEYLEHTTDLIPLVPKPRSSLRKVLEKWTKFRLSNLWRINNNNTITTNKNNSVAETDLELHREHVVYSSDERIEHFLNLLILTLGLTMLISPLWILHVVEGDKTRQLGVITAYIVGFTGLLSFSTVARPFESLAAAAAYSAVLMVFLQMGGGQ